MAAIKRQKVSEAAPCAHVSNTDYTQIKSYRMLLRLELDSGVGSSYLYNSEYRYVKADRETVSH